MYVCVVYVWCVYVWGGVICGVCMVYVWYIDDVWCVCYVCVCL